MASVYDDVPSLSVTTKAANLSEKTFLFITGTAGDGSGLKKNSEGNL